jgi:fatty acid CoA ligase FadD36
MITCGGYRISGLELENVLLGHPGVAEAAVLGAPHEQLGEQVPLQGSGVPSEDSGWIAGCQFTDVSSLCLLGMSIMRARCK